MANIVQQSKRMLSALHSLCEPFDPQNSQQIIDIVTHDICSKFAVAKILRCCGRHDIHTLLESMYAVCESFARGFDLDMHLKWNSEMCLVCARILVRAGAKCAPDSLSILEKAIQKRTYPPPLPYRLF